MAVRFINCDLEVESPRSLEHLLVDFSFTEVHCLGYQKTARGCLANFEISHFQSDPDSIISEFCDIIERCSGAANSAWSDAFCRKFDLGYECDSSLGFFRSDLKADTVRRAAALGASIVVTIYTNPAAHLDEDCPPYEETTDGGTLR